MSKTDGLWTSHDNGKTWSTFASDVSANGGSRKVFIPMVSEPISRFKWTERKDSENDITHWSTTAYGMKLIIWND